MRDIVVFFAIAFALAWTTWLVLGRVAATMGLDTATLVGMVEPGELGDTPTPLPGWALYGLTRLIDFSFSIAGIVMIALTTGTDGLRRLGRRLLAWRLAPRWYAVALLPVALYAAAAAWTTIAEGGEVALTVDALLTVLFSLSAGLLVSLLLRGAMGEELGLRGFVLPRLQARTTPVRASLVIGSLWGLWHLPVLLGRDIAAILIYLVFVYAVTMLFTWLFNRTSGSLLPVLLLHATINWEEGIEVVFPSVHGTDWETLPVVALVLPRRRCGGEPTARLTCVPPAHVGSGQGNRSTRSYARIAAWAKRFDPPAEAFRLPDPADVSLRDSASTDDPLHGLARHGGDPIEVGVVVQDREAFRLGDRRDEQVGQLHGPVLRLAHERSLHLDRSPFASRAAVHELQPLQDRLLRLLVVGQRACRVAHLEQRHGSHGDPVRIDEGPEHLPHLRDSEPSERRGVDEPAGRRRHRRHASARRSSSSRSRTESPNAATCSSLSELGSCSSA